jgi:hypothetical protein
MERNYTLLISELTEEDREAVEAHIHVLSHELQQCEGCVQLYQKGKGSSIEMVGALNALQDALAEFGRTVIKTHRLPRL